jgi:5-methyltetrahydrofolate--homocysteine methyltransferase
MNFREYLAGCVRDKRPVIIDGGMGTMIQAAGITDYGAPEELNLSRPELIRSIHGAYLEAGADIITANTFGCGPIKLQGASITTAEAAHAGIRLVKEALQPAGGAEHYAAFDMGPTGALLEPLGDLSFEAAYNSFAVAARAAEEAGADLVIIETMSDLYEAKAAILAVKENTGLPILVSASFQPNLRTLTGADAETAAVYLEALSPDAIGWNCGGGLDDAARLTRDFCRVSRLPVLVQPNAGLPVVEAGRAVYKLSPGDFARAQAAHYREGAILLGGCCGTTPAHIAALVRSLRTLDGSGRSLDGSGGSLDGSGRSLNGSGRSLDGSGRSRAAPGPAEEPATRVCSGRAMVEIGGKAGPVIIGERINPTGKKRYKEALLAGDTAFILDEAEAQIRAGAHILDLNLGLPGIDEAAMVEQALGLLQKTFAAPLEIDSSEPAVLERALRKYNGKALVNSVNGKQAVMDAVFPLIAQYGGVVVALTLDDTGIPPTAEGRLAIADRILAEAARYGIPHEDILIDTLTLTVSSQQEEALENLRAIGLVKARYGHLGVKTLLGVSNISFGLPRRDIVNSRFFAMALYAGLDACIINPLSEDMMQTWRAYRTLAGFDGNCLDYIGRYAGTIAASAAAAPLTGSAVCAEPRAQTTTLHEIIIKGYKDRSAEAARELLKTTAPLDIINGHIVPALDIVGAEYEAGRSFLPQLLLSAATVQAAFEVIKAAMAAAGTVQEIRGPVVLATVHGDIHDIGKNIVKALLENYGFGVIDLGKNVPPETVVETVLSKDIKLLGLSALMTTTVASMEKTIAALRKALAEQGKSCIVMVGGAVLTADYARQIGADYYAKDALASVAVAQKVFG